MSSLRRRLRLADSSSDEDEPAADNRHHQPQSNSTSNSDAQMVEAEAASAAQTLASTTLNSTPNPSHNFPSPPLEVFDDIDEEFIDVSEDLSPPDEDPVVEEAVEMPTPMSGERAAKEVGSPIGEVLRKLGVRVREEWLKQSVRAMEQSVIGFGGFGDEKRAELCFGQVLMSDLNSCGGRILPENVAGMHFVDLAGPFVLQVDEILNMSCPLRQRYQKAAPGSKRCLKLSMTDGVQRVFGMEYRPIKDLDVLAPAGLKVAIRNVQVRHGILMLVPEVIEVLGGMVEDLEAAHQRLVTEINKPPRGRRPRMGDVPPLATRATRAAWLAADFTGPVQSQNPRSQELGPFRTEANVSGPDQVSHSRTPTRASGPTQTFHSGAQATSFPQHHPSRTVEVRRLPTRATAGTFPSVSPCDSVPDRNETFHSRSRSSGPLKLPAVSGPNQTSDSVPDRNQTFQFRSQCSDSLQTFSVQPSGPNQTLQGSFQSALKDAAVTIGDHVNRMTINDMHNEIHLGATRPNGSSNTFIDLDDFDMFEDGVETNARTTADNDPFSTPNEDVRDTVMIDEVEYPVILEGDKEIPFTYLSSLSAKLSAAENIVTSVQGKIKCFLTGVKGFQYKERSTYELQAYVDDGSLISEILIAHSVVLNGIGYTPTEVNAALSSSDSNTVRRMKETMKQFQLFLVNFEGVMLLELNRSSPTPVAIEMNQGCLASDAWSLLRRSKSFTTIQTPRSFNAEVIDVSP